MDTEKSIRRSYWKYDNRKIYEIGRGYVSVTEVVREFILGAEIQIIQRRTGREVTKSVLGRYLGFKLSDYFETLDLRTIREKFKVLGGEMPKYYRVFYKNARGGVDEFCEQQPNVPLKLVKFSKREVVEKIQ